MRLMFDFKCKEGHKFEKLVEPEVFIKECPDCGDLARRQFAAPRSNLEGITGAFPGAAEKWARTREERARVEAKRDQS